MRGRGIQIIAHVVASATFAFLVLPILAVIPASFTSTSFVQLPPEHLSLRWYRVFFSDLGWLHSLSTSLEVALLATAFSLIVGTTAAIGIERLSPFLRSIVLGLVLSPLIVPVIMTAIALYYVSRLVGLQDTVLGLALGHALLCLPFVVVNVSVSLQALDPSLIRAAAGLGASSWYGFRTVIFPFILPGLAGGAAFAFIASFDEVVISIFLSGIQAKTLPVKMWEEMRVEFTPVTAVASTLLVVVTLVAFVAVQTVRARRESEVAMERT